MAGQKKKQDNSNLSWQARAYRLGVKARYGNAPRISPLEAHAGANREWHRGYDTMDSRLKTLLEAMLAEVEGQC